MSSSQTKVTSPVAVNHSCSRHSSSQMEKAAAVPVKRNRDDEDTEPVRQDSAVQDQPVKDEQPQPTKTEVVPVATSKPATPLADPIKVTEDAPVPAPDQSATEVHDDAAPEAAPAPLEDAPAAPAALPPTEENHNSSTPDDAVLTRDSKPSIPEQSSPVADAEETLPVKNNEQQEISASAPTEAEQSAPAAIEAEEEEEDDAVPAPAVRTTAAFEEEDKKPEEGTPAADDSATANHREQQHDGPAPVTVGDDMECATVAGEPSTPTKMEGVTSSDNAPAPTAETTTTTTTMTVQKITSVTATPLAIKKSQSPIQESAPPAIASDAQMTTTTTVQETTTYTKVTTTLPASSPLALGTASANQQVTSPNLHKPSRSASVPPVTTDGATEPLAEGTA